MCLVLAIYICHPIFFPSSSCFSFPGANTSLTGGSAPRLWSWKSTGNPMIFMGKTMVSCGFPLKLLKPLRKCSKSSGKSDPTRPLTCTHEWSPIRLDAGKPYSLQLFFLNGLQLSLQSIPSRYIIYWLVCVNPSATIRLNQTNRNLESNASDINY